MTTQIISGSRVLIKPLANRPGRVVGAQPTPRSRITIFLVRYEVGAGPARNSESALYFADELTRVS